ncbi:MAG: hypothetical protein IJ121_06865, partial [Eubacterium sp.]|nr:hypothetical protein [Eubacterium sp.]
AFIDDTTTDELVQLAKANVRLDLTTFEDPQELYSSYIDAIDLSRAVSYRVNSSKSDSNHIIYDVRSGPNLICNVVLTPEGASPGFGRHYWIIDEVRAADITELLTSVMATIDTVSGTELVLNGRPLTDEFLSKTPSPIPDLTRFESELESPPTMMTYEVGPLYGEIHLADAYGNSIAPDGDIVDNSVHFHAFSETQSLRITAPEDLDVYVNGIKLQKKDVFSASLGVLEGLELYTGDAACLTNVYVIDGLYRLPVVTAFEPDGREVTPVASAANSFTFFHRGEPETEEQLLSVAQNYFNAYMDYSAHAFEYTRYANLLGKILPQSNLYNYVYKSQEAMYWASGTQTDYNDLRYENFHQISDYCFGCTVIYSADMTATNWYEQYSYKLENAYELSFVATNGLWLAAGMNVITGA